MIDAGAIGRPLMATASIMYHGADSWHPNPAFFYRREGGGPVHDVGPYFLTALALLLGPIETVRATGFKGFETRTITANGAGERSHRAGRGAHLGACARPLPFRGRGGR